MSRLLDRIRADVSSRGYSTRTGQAYSSWVRQYILFHDKRHPSELGSSHVQLFLDHLILERELSPISRNQALSALRFLYRHVLEGDNGWIDDFQTAKSGRHLPEVLTREQVCRLLAELRGARWLQAALLYGSGLRLTECLELRVKDLQLDRPALLIRSGKGDKDRQAVFPEVLVEPMRAHLERVQGQHTADLAKGTGWVELPRSILRRSPASGRTWALQWVFPAGRHYTCAETGQRRRHHAHPSALQRAVKSALLRSRLPHRASCHTLRHSFATHMIEDGCSIPTLQALMGHANIKTTMQYIHLARNGPLAAGSPMDRIRPGALRYLPDPDE